MSKEQETTEQLFYPCIYNDRTGRVNIPVSKKAMSYEQAREFLERNYITLWLKCDAIPQPVEMIDKPENRRIRQYDS